MTCRGHGQAARRPVNGMQPARERDLNDRTVRPRVRRRREEYRLVQRLVRMANGDLQPSG